MFNHLKIFRYFGATLGLVQENFQIFLQISILDSRFLRLGKFSGSFRPQKRTEIFNDWNKVKKRTFRKFWLF